MEKSRKPYVLKDQTLKSIIRVKAVDKAGNERIVSLQPQSAIKLKWYKNWNNWVIVAVVFSILYLVYRVLYLVYRRWKTRKYNHLKI
jgi:membrane protein YdbS with pleckstrin-like domain